jgi:hypothetical protein
LAAYDFWEQGEDKFFPDTNQTYDFLDHRFTYKEAQSKTLDFPHFCGDYTFPATFNVSPENDCTGDFVFSSGGESPILLNTTEEDPIPFPLTYSMFKGNSFESVVLDNSVLGQSSWSYSSPAAIPASLTTDQGQVIFSAESGPINFTANPGGFAGSIVRIDYCLNNQQTCEQKNSTQNSTSMTTHDLPTSSLNEGFHFLTAKFYTSTTGTVPATTASTSVYIVRPNTSTNPPPGPIPTLTFNQYVNSTLNIAGTISGCGADTTINAKIGITNLTVLANNFNPPPNLNATFEIPQDVSEGPQTVFVDFYSSGIKCATTATIFITLTGLPLL